MGMKGKKNEVLRLGGSEGNILRGIYGEKGAALNSSA